MAPKKIQVNIEKSSKKNLQNEIHKKVKEMKQMNEKIAASLVDRIILDRKETSNLDPTVLKEIKKGILKEGIPKEMVMELNKDLDKIVEDVDKQTTTLQQLEHTMERLKNLTKYMEKKL